MGGVTEELGLNFLFVLDNVTVNSHAWPVTTVLDRTELLFLFSDTQTGILSVSQSVSFYFSETAHSPDFITQVWLEKNTNVK